MPLGWCPTAARFPGRPVQRLDQSHASKPTHATWPSKTQAIRSGRISRRTPGPAGLVPKRTHVAAPNAPPPRRQCPRQCGLRPGAAFCGSRKATDQSLEVRHVNRTLPRPWFGRIVPASHQGRATGYSSIPAPENASESPTGLRSRTSPSGEFLARFAARYKRGKRASSGPGWTPLWFRGCEAFGWGVYGKLDKMPASSQPASTRLGSPGVSAYLPQKRGDSRQAAVQRLPSAAGQGIMSAIGAGTESPIPAIVPPTGGTAAVVAEYLGLELVTRKAKSAAPCAATGRPIRRGDRRDGLVPVVRCPRRRVRLNIPSVERIPLDVVPIGQHDDHRVQGGSPLQVVRARRAPTRSGRLPWRRECCHPSAPRRGDTLFGKLRVGRWCA